MLANVNLPGEGLNSTPSSKEPNSLSEGVPMEVIQLSEGDDPLGSTSCMNLKFYIMNEGVLK